MSTQKEKVFADGFIFSRRDGAPDFVVGRVSVKLEEAVPMLKANARVNDKGERWVNLNILIGKSGKPYMEVDTFVPDSAKAKAPAKQAVEEDDFDDLPF